MRGIRCRWWVGLLLGAVPLLNAWLLLRATVAEVEAALPPSVELIVLEAWSDDAATRMAFDLARRFGGATIVTVGGGVSAAMTAGGCFAGASLGEKTRAQLVSWGLAPERVVALGQAERGTRNESLLIGSWMQREMPQVSSLLIVTEETHRQRSRLTYRNVLPQIEVRVMAPRLAPTRPGPRWRTDRDYLSGLVREFFKLGYYELQGWISPIQLMAAA